MIWGFEGWQAVIIIVTLILTAGGVFWIGAYTVLHIVQTIQHNKTKGNDETVR